MNLFQYLSRYFWAVCLAISLFNYVAAERRLNSTAANDAERAEVARRYLRWFAAAGAVPWLVMGWGQVIGHVPSVWYYFRPQDRNPYVIAWHGSIFLLSVLYAVWVFFADGARKTREYEIFAAIGMRSRKPMPEGVIKLLAAFGPVFVLVSVYSAASMDARIPP